MEYVDKLATSAAETAYLGGAEHMSTVMCETLNSAHAKVKPYDSSIDLRSAWSLRRANSSADGSVPHTGHGCLCLLIIPLTRVYPKVSRLSL
jgi:hypothetical protein